MSNTNISWTSRMLRHCVPDVEVGLALSNGFRLHVSAKKNLGLLRKTARERELAVALLLAGYTGPDAVIYDIGANIGIYTIGFAANRRRNIHSFEPSEVALPYLRRNVEANGLRNVHVHAIVLSDRPGVCIFVLDDITSAQSHVGRPKEAGISLPCTDLNSYVAEHGIPAPNLIKIDVEGHDLEVLRGMSGVLNARPLVYVEGGVRADDGRLESILFLLRHGFSIWNLERTERLPPDTIEYAFLAVAGS